jgi:hypothetical protein
LGNPTAVAITIDSLRRGAKDFGIEFPPGITLQRLEEIITEELRKNPTYGCYNCGGCFHDIIDKLPSCPFCGVFFKPIPDQGYDDGTDEYGRPTDNGQIEEHPIMGDEKSEYTLSDIDPIKNQEETQKKGSVENIRLKQPHQPASKGKDAKPSKRKVTADQKRIKKEKAKQKEQRRKQLKAELPYTEKQLSEMKRTVLIMICGIIGVKKPLAIPTRDELLQEISRQQKAYMDSKPE